MLKALRANGLRHVFLSRGSLGIFAVNTILDKNTAQHSLRSERRAHETAGINTLEK
jgi:hypothetical protein